MAPDSKHKLKRVGLLRHKQDRKELECNPVWHLVAVSGVRLCATSKTQPTLGVRRIRMCGTR